MINLLLCIFDNICIVLPYEINDFIIIMMCADIYDSVACIICKLMMAKRWYQQWGNGNMHTYVE